MCARSVCGTWACMKSMHEEGCGRACMAVLPGCWTVGRYTRAADQMRVCVGRACMHGTSGVRLTACPQAKRLGGRSRTCVGGCSRLRSARSLQPRALAAGTRQRALRPLRVDPATASLQSRVDYSWSYSGYTVDEQASSSREKEIRPPHTPV